MYNFVHRKVADMIRKEIEINNRKKNKMLKTTYGSFIS